eukprot:CAMPEP_0197665498 /NCGR_PEP_ID=MMETSP1338-20131121/59350_1 /TAXON_ID=43686 ORGANISM="Pelagodinium beii, Strain RCC1491" /NCGR_SAMPLE_ID=MMETSP1338 /ASSEMBLY_ACC=CAM_ASM_000754 /LENGTH=106 /DNA_ID=CAMNT_0043244317 /DNA_START=240 /DNA_END=560 /DNA_ORIENTATION=+
MGTSCLCLPSPAWTSADFFHSSLSWAAAAGSFPPQGGPRFLELTSLAQTSVLACGVPSAGDAFSTLADLEWTVAHLECPLSHLECFQNLFCVAAIWTLASRYGAPV